MTDSAEKLLLAMNELADTFDAEADKLLANGFTMGHYAACIPKQCATRIRYAITAHLSAHPVTGRGDANSGWISVADRLPDVDDIYEVVRVMVDGGERSRAFSDFFDGGFSDIAAALLGSSAESYVTHWKHRTPLPAAPMTAASGMDERK